MTISPFTPLSFETRRSDGLESRFVQIFKRSDNILIEAFVGSTETLAVSVSPADGKSFSITPSYAPINSGTQLAFCDISNLDPGVYQVRLNGTGSNWFRVTDDSQVLARTALIQYSNKDNRRRTDAIFLISGMRRFFDFRVPGGFKDSGWSFGVDNEQFTTQSGDPVELYALESTTKTLTMGWQEGVPVWMADKLNRLLTCNYVYIDGKRYARKESAVPEMSVQVEGLDSFVFSQQLQRVTNLNPEIENANALLLRRIDSGEMRTLEIDGTTYNRKI